MSKKTRIYCPGCKLLTISTVEDEDESGRLRQKRASVPGHLDIQVFKRIRVCTSCKYRFTTGEVAFDLIEELAEYRAHFDSWQQARLQLKQRWKTLSEAYAAVGEAIPMLETRYFRTLGRQLRSKTHQKQIADVISRHQSKSPKSANNSAKKRSTL